MGAGVHAKNFISPIPRILFELHLSSSAITYGLDETRRSSSTSVDSMVSTKQLVQQKSPRYCVVRRAARDAITCSSEHSAAYENRSSLP